LTVRVTPSTRAALERIADAQGRRLADVGRDALDEYVRRHAGKASETKSSPGETVKTGKAVRTRVKVAP
jgi:predicted transcriptional regulator